MTFGPDETKAGNIWGEDGEELSQTVSSVLPAGLKF
jgi:hypothetical protein